MTSERVPTTATAPEESTDGFVCEGDDEGGTAPDDSASGIGTRGRSTERSEEKLDKKRSWRASPKKSAKAKGKGTTKGDIECALCECWLPAHEYPVCGQANCRTCKNHWDAMMRMAKRQELFDWIEKVTAAPLKDRRKTLKLFRQKYRCNKDPKLKREFKFMDFAEFFISITIEDKSKKKKLMWKGGFMEFCRSPKGGSHSATDADKMWLDEYANPDKIEAQGGPKHAPLRLATTKSDYVKRSPWRMCRRPSNKSLLGTITLSAQPRPRWTI